MTFKLFSHLQSGQCVELRVHTAGDVRRVLTWGNSRFGFGGGVVPVWSVQEAHSGNQCFFFAVFFFNITLKLNQSHD